MRESKREARDRRRIRVRKKVYGTTDRPRLSVFGSLNHIYVQIIDDLKGHTLVSASTLDRGLEKGRSGHTGNTSSAREVGLLLAKRAAEKNIKRVVFDRGGVKYHGRLKVLAEAAREGGLEF